MTALSHPVGDDGSVTIAFDGDLFEVEDQRNWTDASYKTYGTPLRLPYPVEVTPDDRITQIVTISVTGTPPRAASDTTPADLTIDFNQQIGLPAIGFGSGRKVIEDDRTISRLAALAPSHILADLDLSHEADQWRRRLANAAANAKSIRAALDLSVIAGSTVASWKALAAFMASEEISVRQIFVFPAPAEPITFPRFDLVTSMATVKAAKAAFAKTDIAISGGTRTYFTELNRGIGLSPR